MTTESGAVDVAIVGAGFCGATLAMHLAAEPSIRTALFERDEFARGVAYATENPRHLLNLAAGKMSPFPEKPADFVEWLEGASPAAFVPRLRYAGYLRATFENAIRDADHVTCYRASVVSIVREGDGFLVATARDSVFARSVVLAVGNFAPSDDFIPAALRTDEHYVGNPWTVPFDELSGEVLVAGNGLTAIDVLVELQHRRYGSEVVILSRHGRTPQVHKEYGDIIDVPLDERSPLSMLRSVRTAIDAVERGGGDWRAVVDGIRPLTQAIWQTWPLHEQERFLRHLRPFWETSRRRIPPEIAAVVKAFENTGRLKRTAGRIQNVEKQADGRFRVALSRSAGTTTYLEPNWIINCTGPQVDIERIDDPLIRSLCDARLIAPHPTRIGLRASADGHVIDADGNAHANLFALGTLLRGVLYETISVPELRVQVKALAQKLVSSLVPLET